MFRSVHGIEAKWYQNGNNACYILKVNRLYIKKEIYGNRLENVFFDM